MYDFEEYYEPTLAEVVINEATEKLRETLKESAKNYIDSLISENENLKEKNEKLAKQVYEIEARERSLEFEKKNLLQSIRREHLSELTKNFEIELFRVDYRWNEKEKCNACDKNRKIKFVSPSGKELSENCACAALDGKTYYPQSYICCEFRLDRDGKSITSFYEIKKRNTDDEYYRQNSVHCGTLLEVGFADFESLKFDYATFFRSKEDAQKYCDFLNSKEDKPNE